VATVALDRKNSKKLTAALLRLGRVRGPVKDETGVVLGDLTSKSDPVLEYQNFTLPAKREFFPQCEAVAKFEGDNVREAADGDRAAVVFGIRPCDALALSHVERVFCDEKYADPYFRGRRDAALVISLACDKAGPSCFCTSAGGGPASAKGADILSSNIGTALLFDSVTAKGESFLKKNKGLFRKPTAAELTKREKQAADVSRRMKAVDTAAAVKSLAAGRPAAFWEGISETCLSCGACTFLCPTCHCFDLRDDIGTGARLRVHDACMFATFVTEASGHNPRARKGERMRQRVMHKFSYAPENYDTVFCVGCGRCVEACPSNIDIRETLAGVTE
jgi:sulfhydrogenase subunit beta (sulfur reductase)